MATDKHRITISLTDEQYSIVERLARLQKWPLSRVLVDVLDQAFPVMETVADTLEMAQKASDTAKANFKRAAEKAEEELRPLADFARSQFDMFAAELGRVCEAAEGAEEAERREVSEAHARRTDAEAPSPRPVITGAMSPQRDPRKGGRSGAGGPKVRSSKGAA